VKKNQEKINQEITKIKLAAIAMVSRQSLTFC
jgi:hypothetical protein